MQVNRLIEIVYILLEKGKVTAEELAKRFEVSTRTIYRDIECLSIAKIPVFMEKGHNGGISLIDGYTLNKAILSDSEKIEIMSALSAVGAVDINGSNAIAKLSSIFGGNNGDWIEVDFSNWCNNVNIENKFEELKLSILQKSIISFEYVSSDGSITSRRVVPLKLCFKAQAWYLYAYCYYRQDYRFFKLSRLNNLTLLQDKHQLAVPQRVLDKKDYYQLDTISVQLKIDNSQGSRVYDEFSSIDMDDDGNYIVEMNCPHNEYLYNYILSFGEHCEVLHPIELKCEIKKYMENIYRKYASINIQGK